MTAQELLRAARASHAMIATAESCTGGLVAGAITEIAGASDIFDRGFVTYSNQAKTDLLGVDPAQIEEHGAVSEVVARAMAEGALARSQATIAIAVTGVAGPGGSDHKPEGMVCFALAAHDHETKSETIQFGPLGRSEIRAQSVQIALQRLVDAL